MSDAPVAFPKKADQPRLDQYVHYDKLYFADAFDAFSIKVNSKDWSREYRKLRYIAANFAGLISKTMADMLFGETLTFDYDNENNQKFADAVVEDNQLITQLHESALGNSRRGDALFKLRIGQRNPAVKDSPSTLIFEEVTPAYYFPEFDQHSTRNVPKCDVLANTFKVEKDTYLHKEMHEPGWIYNEVYRYSPEEGKIISQEDVTKFGYEEQEETKIKRSLVFHIPNVRDSSGFWGTSDYRDLESLFFALNNRITSIDNILDKHSDPILAVPPGVLKEDGTVRKEALGMFEVDNESPGFNKPEYIVWNANLESAFDEVDRIVDMLFMFSEISPATVGKDKEGQADSGRALKFKLLATIRKRNRKRAYYDQAIKDMMETGFELAKAHDVSINKLKPAEIERPKLKWSNGILNDEIEQAEYVDKRITQGTMSAADGISYLDNVTPSDAKKKAAEIDQENTAPEVVNNQGDKTGDQTDKDQPEPEAVAR